MKTILKTALVHLVIITSATLAVHGHTSQTNNLAGKYVYKTHREGKGGFHNILEISNRAGGRIHVSFEGTYFYLAGREETFHEGSGEGEGRLAGNVATVNLSDGAGGSCRLTLTFSAGRVTVKTGTICQINVNPEGIYKRDTSGAGPAESGEPVLTPPVAAPKAKGLEVCPDPHAPCPSTAHEFADYELSFRLPAPLKAGRQYKSVPFYAIIVKTYDEEDCDADDHTASVERERLRIQKIYPTRKVFGSYSCPNLDAVDYNFAGRLDQSGERVLIMTFIAVYAGKSPAEAKEFLSYVRTLFPDAVLKQMTAGYEIMDQ